jgi:hypothetical protein
MEHTTITREDLIQFFEDRPSLSRDGVAREAGISPDTLRFSMNGMRGLTNRTTRLLSPILYKYGFKREISQ